jgi:hypothetical protein
MLPRLQPFAWPSRTGILKLASMDFMGLATATQGQSGTSMSPSRSGKYRVRIGFLGGPCEGR